MPFPGNVFCQLLDLQNLKARNDWDRAFVKREILEAYPEDGGYVTYMRALLSFSLRDRSFVLHLPPAKEVGCYGEKAIFRLIRDACHPAKPEGDDGLVRVQNGGNFYVVTPDEKQPEAACKIFGLTNNLYNGWIPEAHTEWIQRRIVPRKFNEWRDNVVEGYQIFQELQSGAKLLLHRHVIFFFKICISNNKIRKKGLCSIIIPPPPCNVVKKDLLPFSGYNYNKSATLHGGGGFEKHRVCCVSNT